MPTAQNDDLQIKINQEIYKQNFELSIRNKTLSTLRALYAITTSSTNISETAQKIVNTIVGELSVATARISIVDNEREVLQTIAVNKNPVIDQIIQTLKRPLADLAIPLSSNSNLAITALNDKQPRVTGNFLDVMNPAVSQDEADIISRMTGVKSILIFPLVLNEMAFGILTIGFSKNEKDLSRSEHETLEQLVPVVAIAIDRVRLFDDLEKANDRLHELDKLKSEFVSVASHELRTPMTAIKSYLWMAIAGRGGNITDKQKYYLERAYISTDRLIKLVNDLLNVSRIESGRLSVDMQKVSLSQFAADVIAEVKPRADELGIKIVNETGNTPLPEVLADTDKIKEVMINLIGNALKFSKKGGEIKTWCERHDNFVRVFVSDQGEGIDPADLPKLFQKFGLVKGSYVTNQNAAQGTGLGLYISKSIIDLHGGEIKASSEGRGKGATFYFSLPVFTQEAFLEAQKHKGTEGLGIIHSTID